MNCESRNEPGYGLYWRGKSAAARLVDAPAAARLVPCPGEGVDEDATRNLFIAGDNLEALKLLRGEYAGRVKLVYIDPPYNTGGRLVYHDNFRDSRPAAKSAKSAGDRAAEGEIESPAARRHSAWLSFMYPRLALAREMLAGDGVIAISIDDNEARQLGLLCDEIFGSGNFLAQVTALANPRGRQSTAHFAAVHEYLLFYARDAARCRIGAFPLSAEQRGQFNLADADGRAYRLLGLRQRGADSLRGDAPTMFFPLYVDPDRMTVAPAPDAGHRAEVIPRKSDGREGRWMWGSEKCRRDRALLVPRWIARRGEFDIFVKDYLDRDGAERGRKATTVWDGRHLNTQNGTREVKALLGAHTAAFFPKPVAYLRDIVALAAGGDDLVLDFFAGSGTTGHAVLAQNLADGGRRRFILVQLPEPLDPESKTGRPAHEFCRRIGVEPTLAEVAKERLRRAAAALRTEPNAAGTDLGFRVCRLAEIPS